MVVVFGNAVSESLAIYFHEIVVLVICSPPSLKVPFLSLNKATRIPVESPNFCESQQQVPGGSSTSLATEEEYNILCIRI